MVKFFELILEITLLFLITYTYGSDFEYARIIGTPRLTCGETSLLFQFETSVPFQGRVYIQDKPDLPACSASFHTNFSPNASVIFDFEKCLDESKSLNGSRAFSGFLAIGFHPLVMTTADRVFSVKCVDETPPDPLFTKTKPMVTCEHIVRQATRWEAATKFHIGDSIVHDWSCRFAKNDDAKYLAVLTFCNAVSKTGRIIHLIDENGCVVDSELLGELSYSNYQVKIYARAKMFRFITGEKIRFECRIQMCRRGMGGCNANLFPPKCAFTRDEIVKREEAKKARLSVPNDHYNTNLLKEGVHFEHQLQVSSDWVTVEHNEYTNIGSLRERYFVAAAINHSLIDMDRPKLGENYFMEPSSSNSNDRAVSKPIFPTSTSPVLISRNQQSVNRIPELMKINTLDYDNIDELHPDFDRQLFIGDANSLSKEKRAPADEALLNRSSTTRSTTTTSRTPISKIQRLSQTWTARLIATTSTTVTTTTTLRAATTTSSRGSTTTLYFPLSKKNNQWFPDKASVLNSNNVNWELSNNFDNKREPLPFDFIPKVSPTTKRAPLKVVYRPNQSFNLLPNDNDLELMDLNTGEPPFEMDSAEMDKVAPFDLNRVQEQFENHREQWRLDEISLNETDALPQCSNGTQAVNGTLDNHKCHWKSMENILVAWSFGSLVIWGILASICFYRRNNRKPDWVRRREAMSTCVIHPEHPWTHQDAFIEPKNTFKKEIDLQRL